jgi:hypothetical protein
VMDTLQILSCLWVGAVFDAYLGSVEGTFGSELAAGVRAGFGEPGSNANARRSLALVQPCEYRVYRGGETMNYALRRRVAARGATRSGGGGPHDRPPP